MNGPQDDVEAFIATWGESGGSERSNYQLFLTQLCALLGVEQPQPSKEIESENAYVFERKVKVRRIEGKETPNYIDLYKRRCFVLEAKQSRKRRAEVENLKQLGFSLPEMRTGSGQRGGTQWDVLMRGAREQAERYARSLPVEEGWPPFLIVVDVGHVIELYADFSLQGKYYAQFPDRQSYRITLDDLRKPEIRERLRLIWSDPNALNPALRSAEVTREVAELLSKLSMSLEKRFARADGKAMSEVTRASRDHDVAERVALFLMRCLFTMFSEDVGLLKRASFTGLLERYRGKAAKIRIPLQRLWQDMDKGGFSPEIEEDVLRFNGGLFRNAEALEIDEEELSWLIIAARRDWKDVEPAIFGTLLEKALDERLRAQLGAHYTPRAYVERLVVTTLIEPLNEEWRDVQAAAAMKMREGDDEGARALVRACHRRLCATRILDPACGTGNFLYVALELMKRLEGEILETLFDMGETQTTLDLEHHTVGPHQFLGLEINPRAVAIAELVLWIGYLQWHFRTRGQAMPSEPVLRKFDNIREQDAVIATDRWEIMRDEHGRPLSRWDGETMKRHPVTGEEIPDETARVEMRRYVNPRPAPWPEADFVIGNPPFIGGKDMRQRLGDGYAEACWTARPHIPGGADFVMHFWDKAAELLRMGKIRRFGFITTNSITQVFSRRVIQHHLEAKKPLSLVMAIPDHPWQKSADKAAVRIAMTVAEAGERPGVLCRVVDERDLNSDAPIVELTRTAGKVWADLTVGANVAAAKELKANERLSNRGVVLHGSGFIVTPQQALGLGLGKVPGLEKYILDYRNGRDLTSRPRRVMVIDLFPLTEDEVRDRFPAVYQHVYDHVKPERDQNNRESRRKNWWIFGEPISTFRPVLKNIPRYIATVETSKHRFFQFLDASVRPDNMLVCIGLADAFYLAVLSSRFHRVWALAAGGRLGVGNDPRYSKTRCFDPFPFPVVPEAKRGRLRDLGERLDAHRKAVLDRHSQLTMTALYNVLEQVRAGATLTPADRDVYDAGLVGVLKSLHDEIDHAVAEAYGWPDDLSDAEILDHVVALNQNRAQEEAEGTVYWLRPDLQAGEEPDLARGTQYEAVLDIARGEEKKPRFPGDMPEQVAMVRAVLDSAPRVWLASDLARTFSQGRKVEGKVLSVLQTLAVLGQARHVGEGYVSVE